jgi:hypothetical protein
MKRVSVALTVATDQPDESEWVRISPHLLDQVGIRGSERFRLHFGVRSAPVRLRPDPALAPGTLCLPPPLAEQLAALPDLTLTLYRQGETGLRLGPLIGLLIAQEKMKRLLGGARDRVYCRYDRYAREAGALLLFLTPGGIDAATGTVRGYLHEAEGTEGCRWRSVLTTLPRAIFDRCFGQEGRAKAGWVRKVAADWGALVFNRQHKITKLQAFDALQEYVRLSIHLPFTARLTPSTLAQAIEHCTDLYLKPNALAKGEGVYRLTRTQNGWELRGRNAAAEGPKRFEAKADLYAQLMQTLPQGIEYVLQKGIPLATFLGNRFDFRSQVQKDGKGQWRLGGLVARIAPDGSAITSPRSGGEVAAADVALTGAFGGRAKAILEELERVSLLIARAIDRELGPCAELGLDLGVTEKGAVKLIEVNGIPLRVSLGRLKDPWVTERVNRFPIHHAAYLDTQEVISCDGRNRSPYRQTLHGAYYRRDAGRASNPAPSIHR